MGYQGEQCPRCGSMDGFIRSEKKDSQKTLDGKAIEIFGKKKVPVCIKCGKWSSREDIKKVFSY